jgi:uncharacterized glyoxalase superfamily protein PhnB
VDVLGFEETAVYGDGDRVDHAQLSWPLGGGVMLGSLRDDADDPWAFQPGTFGAYVVIDDPAQLFDRVKASGGRIARPLKDTDWGRETLPCSTLKATSGRLAPIVGNLGRPNVPR